MDMNKCRPYTLKHVFTSAGIDLNTTLLNFHQPIVRFCGQINLPCFISVFFLGHVFRFSHISPLASWPMNPRLMIYDQEVGSLTFRDWLWQLLCSFTFYYNPVQIANHAYWIRNYIPRCCTGVGRGVYPTPITPTQRWPISKCYYVGASIPTEVGKCHLCDNCILVTGHAEFKDIETQRYSSCIIIGCGKAIFP